MAKQNAIIVDIDGTLSDASGRLHYITNGNKNFKAFFAECHKDPCREHIKAICKCYPGVVLLLTGRHEELRKTTEKWLNDNEVHYDYLFMKPNHKQFIKDVVFKKEIYLDVISRVYDIDYAIDDRELILEMWASIGVTAFHESKIKRMD